MMLKSKNMASPSLLVEWREKAGEHPYAIGAVDYPEDWGWENEDVTHTDIIRWVKHLGPIYVYCKESNLLIVYSI